MSGDAMQEGNSFHSAMGENQRSALRAVNGEVRCTARSCVADLCLASR